MPRIEQGTGRFGKAVDRTLPKMLQQRNFHAKLFKFARSDWRKFSGLCVTLFTYRSEQKKYRQKRAKGVRRVKKSVLMAMAFIAILFAATAQGWAAGLVAKVDISSQTMTISQYGRVIHTWRVSTARKGYHTPRGSWRPTRLHRMWYSRKYEMSPMPYSVFFRGGYAIHGTGAVKQLGRPASHGCIRLHTANAAQFYSLVKQVGRGNTRIVVVN